MKIPIPTRLSDVATICVFVAMSMEGYCQAPTGSNAKMGAASQGAHLDIAEAERFFNPTSDPNDKPIRDRLQVADKDYRSGKIAECEVVLRTAIRDFPASAPVHVSFGRFLYAQKRYPEAEDSFQSALRLDKAAYIYVDLGTLYAEALDRPIDALDYFYKALEKDPDNAGAHYAAGQILTKLVQPGQARTEFTSAARLDPKNPLPRVALARLSIQEQKTDQAIEEYLKALSLAPNNPVLSLELADVYSALKRDGEAIPLYLSAAQTGAKDFGAWNRLGMFYQSRGRLPEANEAYAKELSLNPNSTLALNNRAALALDGFGTPAEAILWARQAVAISPKNSSYLDTLGALLEKDGKLDEARQTLENARLIDPGYVLIRYHLVIVLRRLGKSVEAKALVRETLKDDRVFPERTLFKKLDVELNAAASE